MKSKFNIGFWEEVYNNERAPILDLLKSKALKVKELENTDILGLKEADQQKHFNKMKAIENEANTIFGFLKFTDEMKTQYWGSLEELIIQNDIKL